MLGHFILEQRQEILDPKLFLLICESDQKWCWSLRRSDHGRLSQLLCLLSSLPYDLLDDIDSLTEGNQWAECKLEPMRRTLADIVKQASISATEEANDENVWTLEKLLPTWNPRRRVYSSPFGGPAIRTFKNRSGFYRIVDAVKDDSENFATRMASLMGLKSFPEALGDLAALFSEAIKCYRTKALGLKAFRGAAERLLNEAREFVIGLTVYFEFVHPVWVSLSTPEKLQLQFLDYKAESVQTFLAAEARDYAKSILGELSKPSSESEDSGIDMTQSLLIDSSSGDPT